MNVCTVIAKNYLAHARVLARSLAENNPGSRLWTLIIDDFSHYIDPAQEPFDVLTPAAIGCEQFTQMALRYSVLELSTAVKPWLLRHLMGETGAPVTYLDPDIKIFGSLKPLDDLAARHGLVLIPHNNQPIPADGRRPGQVDIMIAGVYNLGYVTLAPRPEIESLLDWWADRLLRDCRVDPIWGYFVDQRWFDLAPGLVGDLAIVRDPEYNVAYWNLHGRRLERHGQEHLVDGRPLAFFHFSGFDPEHPLVLSRHQDRVDVLADPVLERLLAEYAAGVMGEGYAISRHWPYSYGAMGDGTQLDETLRALYDVFTDEHEQRGQRSPSPFDLEGIRIFDDWLKGQAPGALPGVSRALAHVYHGRTDLRAAYPDLAGAGGAGLIAWAEEYGRREAPLLSRAMNDFNGSGHTSPASAERDEIVSDEPSEALRDDPWGANVIGSFSSELEAGQAARNVVSALDAAGVPTVPILSQTTAVGRHDTSYLTAPLEDAPFPVNLLCIDGDALPDFVRYAGREAFAGRYSIGLWSWPVSRLPESWRSSFRLLEEVWTPSTYVATALAPIATVPVTPVPIPVSVPPLESHSRAQLGLPEGGFLFLFSFDYSSGFKRKNPLAVIEAFKSAVRDGDGAELVIRCVNSDRAPDSHAELLAAAARPEITVIDRSMGPAEACSVTALCDCFVSLHRAESSGLAMAEAMWQGKPVIATGYSGNLDFMTESNSLLVNHRLVPIGAGADPYPADAEWAQPDVEHAAARVREVLDDRAAARHLGTRGAEDIRRTHSPAAAGEIMARRLESVRATGRVRFAADDTLEVAQAVASLPLRVQESFRRRAAPGRGRRVRELARQAVLRAMRPIITPQQSVNEGVISALTELNHSIVEVRREDAGKRAALLAQLRHYERLIPLTEAQVSGIDEIKRMLTLETDRGVYLALSELGHRRATIAAEAGAPSETVALTGFELRVFSQNGEDGVLAEILRRTGAPARFFVEFGVESGREGNCVYLADVAGWRGLFLEADDEMYRQLESKYAAAEKVQTIRARVTPQSVERLFEQADVPAEPDVLSIDVDGQDYWIWKAIECYRPRVVVIEYNSSLDPRRRLVQPNEPGHSWDGTEYYGASLGGLRTLGEDKGYRLVHTELSGVNAFFVRADLAPDAFSEPDEVAVRGTPNYYQRGIRHPAARAGARYLELDSGKLVPDVDANE